MIGVGVLKGQKRAKKTIFGLFEFSDLPDISSEIIHDTPPSKMIIYVKQLHIKVGDDTFKCAEEDTC